MKQTNEKKNAVRRDTVLKVWRAIRRYRLLLILSLAISLFALFSNSIQHSS